VHIWLFFGEKIVEKDEDGAERRPERDREWKRGGRIQEHDPVVRV
jgi:hypothetical protein